MAWYIRDLYFLGLGLTLTPFIPTSTYTRVRRPQTTSIFDSYVELYQPITAHRLTNCPGVSSYRTEDFTPPVETMFRASSPSEGRVRPGTVF